MSLEDQIKRLKKDNRGLKIAFGIAITSSLYQTGLGVVATTINNSKTFGAESNMAGELLRAGKMALCDNCTPIEKLLLKKDPTPSQAFAQASLHQLNGDPMGKQVIDAAIKKGVQMESDGDHFSQSCMAAAYYDPSWGLVGYTLGGLEGKKESKILTTELAHEFFHSIQGIENMPFRNEPKDKLIYHLTLEAGAYAYGAMIENRLEKKIEDTAALDTASKRMHALLTSDAHRGLRQQYLISYNPTFADYDMPAQKISLDDLKRLATLPDGRSFFPKNLSVSDIDMTIRKDLYNEMMQRKPRVPAPAPAPTPTPTAEETGSEKSAVQQHKEAICRELRAKNPVYRAS